jgi:hypothetical protein
MDITKLPPARTLGSLLVEEARRLQSRNVPVPAWLGPFTLVRGHINALPLASVSRFQRRDAEISSPAAPDFGSWLEQGVSPAGSRAVSPAIPRRSGLRGTARTGPATADEVATAGKPLPPEVRAAFSAAAGETAIGVDARVHDDEASDALARRERAAAITIGQHIYFRQGQFRPQERKGQALLAHEMVHVRAAMQPNSAWQRATTGGVQKEEQAALAREQQVLLNGLEASHPAAPPPLTGGTAANWPGRAEHRLSSSPALRPLAAATDRNISPLARGTGSRAQPAAAEGPRPSYQDLFRQIRIDFERGG